MGYVGRKINKNELLNLGKGRGDRGASVSYRKECPRQRRGLVNLLSWADLTRILSQDKYEYEY